MSNTKHTPAPWQIGIRDPADNTLHIIGSGGRTVKRCTLAHVTPRPHYADNQEADAALIVRAVNSHAALVESLEALFEHCTMIHKHWGEGSNQREADAAVKQARAALELAKES